MSGRAGKRLRIFSDTARAAFDFILPRSCIICDAEITRGMLCNNCLEYLPVTNPPLCPSCGRPVKKSGPCVFCRDTDALDHGRAWLLFIPDADKVIHHFKYGRKTALSKLMGRAMANIIRSDFILSQADVIAAVPLHWWKKMRRSYNQAEILARVISAETSIERKELLRRRKPTRTQTRLSDEARRRNVREAFEVRVDVKNKKVLLIDDVLTTGATMKECCRVLREGGASAVYSCVAAITPCPK